MEVLPLASVIWEGGRGVGFWCEGQGFGRSEGCGGHDSGVSIIFTLGLSHLGLGGGGKLVGGGGAGAYQGVKGLWGRGVEQSFSE